MMNEVELYDARIYLIGCALSGMLANCPEKYERAAEDAIAQADEILLQLGLVGDSNH